MKRAAPAEPRPLWREVSTLYSPPPPRSILHSQEVPPYDNGLAGSELFRRLSDRWAPSLSGGFQAPRLLWAHDSQNHHHHPASRTPPCSPNVFSF